ncbi:MAG: tetratricopeptide repeat protein [Alphaproteobacteria bacterium]|nr:tetratricopeptide repeat protein [Alphaproteobacteria bacterium]
MADLLREIDEELQREHMAALWRKYQVLIMGIIACLIFGTAANSAWKQHVAQKEVSLSVALGSVATRPEMQDAEKIEAFQAFARSNPGAGQGVLAQMAGISVMLRANKTDEALKALDALANDRTASPLTQDYARLVRIQVQFEKGDPVQLRQQLAPLAAEGQPWRYTARVLQGGLYGKHGDNAKAKEIFQTLSQDNQAPITIRDSARLLARYYATQG